MEASARDIVPLFVYGTLRENGGLHGMIADAVVHAPVTATAQGVLYSNKSRTYPYLMTFPFTGDVSAVTGDLLFVRKGIEFNQVTLMELGAGYDMVVIDVELRVGKTKAIAFPFNQSGLQYPEELGERIPGGDWLEWERTHGRKNFRQIM